MIAPKKSKLFIKVFNIYLARTIKKHFYRLYLDDTNYVKDENAKLFIANHSNWWDGLMVHYLNEKVITGESYAMMSEKGLKDFPFFRKIGAFSVNPLKPKSLYQSLKFAEDLLNGGNNVWLFPQGREEHLEKASLRFQSGLAYLMEKSSISVQPVAFYYTFTHHQKPEVFIKIGKVIQYSSEKYNREQLTRLMEQHLNELVAEVRLAIIQENYHEFKIVQAGKMTASEWFTSIKRLFKRGVNQK